MIHLCHQLAIKTNEEKNLGTGYGNETVDQNNIFNTMNETEFDIDGNGELKRNNETILNTDISTYTTQNEALESDTQS